jgi:S-disulfanyl-L-cysteine oxidoreductase SoxD
MSRSSVGFFIGLALASCLTSPAAAQLPTYGVGRSPSPGEIKAWDLTIPPDGRGLPPGSGRATAGAEVYLQRCAVCHGKEGEKPKYNPGFTTLFGGRGTLASDKPVLTVGSFWQSATTLWSYIRRSQPFDEPGVLSPDEVYAVTAYLLYRNGIIGENDVLDATTLLQVKMPNRDGFVPDSRPDVGPTARGKAGNRP